MITKQYYIIGVQGDNRQNLKELSLSEINIIEESCSVIYKFNYFDKRDIEIQENLNEFLKVYENSKKIGFSKITDNSVFISIRTNIEK